MTKAVTDVLGELLRQREVEGWTTTHDDEHGDRELARASLSYLRHYVQRQWCYEADQPDDYQNEPPSDYWPWAEKWWKPKDPRRDLIRAAALLLAEVERLDRGSPLSDAAQDREGEQ